MKSLEIFSYTVDTVVEIGKQMAHFETIYYYVLTIDFIGRASEASETSLLWGNW